jgi:hypothetical protein
MNSTLRWIHGQQTTTEDNMNIITIRCKAFSHEGVRLNQIRVDSDGTVRVYDSAAGYFTLRHSLSDKLVRKLSRRA